MVARVPCEASRGSSVSRTGAPGSAPCVAALCRTTGSPRATWPPSSTSSFSSPTGTSPAMPPRPSPSCRSTRTRSSECAVSLRPAQGGLVGAVCPRGGWLPGTDTVPRASRVAQARLPSPRCTAVLNCRWPRPALPQPGCPHQVSALPCPTTCGRVLTVPLYPPQRPVLRQQRPSDAQVPPRRAEPAQQGRQSRPRPG